MRFEWDNAKSETNRRKHGVGFEEARTVFDDPLAVIFDDVQHSVGERREFLIGHSAGHRLLLVCFTERLGAVRIFSSRPASPQEQRDYEEGSNLQRF